MNKISNIFGSQRLFAIRIVWIKQKHLPLGKWSIINIAGEVRPSTKTINHTMARGKQPGNIKWKATCETKEMAAIAPQEWPDK